MQDNHLFGGMMPPRAQAAASKATSGTVSLVASLVVGNTPAAANKLGIVEGSWKEAEPRCVLLASPNQVGPQSTSFPPSAADNAFYAGLLDSVGTAWVDSVNKPMALVLEYGNGSTQETVWCDYIPGAYNLPPCSWVRVSALPWRTSPWALNNAMQLSASIAPGNMNDVHAPTATGRIVAAGPWDFFVPSHARAFTISTEGDTGPDVVTCTQAAYCLRNYSTGQFVPGYDPIDCFPGPTQFLHVAHTTPTEALTLQWLLQL